MSESFVLYRLPKESEIHFIDDAEAKTVSSMEAIKGSAFVISPFDENAQTPLISYNLALSRSISKDEVLKLAIHPPYEDIKTISISKEEHIQGVHKMIALIKNHDLDKGVLSRVKQIKRQNESISKIFLRLCERYPTAFVYVASLPTGEMWCGASPETLATFKDGIFKTMALAGTQLINDRNIGDIKWESKEQEEQKWVQTHISNIFKTSKIKFKKSDIYTAPAGHIAHLRNDFWAHTTKEQAHRLIPMLHPTPAVCGTPTLAAKSIILDLEAHQRTYYSGFLGVLSPQNTQVFVNLRCM